MPIIPRFSVFMGLSFVNLSLSPSLVRPTVIPICNKANMTVKLDLLDKLVKLVKLDNLTVKPVTKSWGYAQGWGYVRWELCYAQDLFPGKTILKYQH